MFTQIKDDYEKELWLSEIIRFNRLQDASVVEVANVFRYILIDLPTAWSILTPDDPIRPEYADRWEEKYGLWRHAGGRHLEHNILGMAFAWWAQDDSKRLTDFVLSDSPDFGALKVSNGRHYCIRGDIGKCSSIAFYEGLLALHMHSLWISVLGWDRQLVIEFGYDVSTYLLYRRTQHFSPKKLKEEELRRIFFCDQCHRWTIRPEVLERFRKNGLFGQQKMINV